MPANDRERDMHALRNIIEEAHVLMTTIDLPQGRGKRAASLLTSALSIVDDMISLPPAAVSLGQRGGLKTAERGSEYFSALAAKRKVKAGGRPKKPA